MPSSPARRTSKHRLEDTIENKHLLASLIMVKIEITLLSILHIGRSCDS